MGVAHLPISATAGRRLLDLPPALRRSFWSTASAQATSATAAAAAASSPEVYDVVCVGGGPAGLSLVAALRSHPSTRALKIALLDSQDLTSPRPAAAADTYSNRCSSLTPSSLRFLKNIGVWNKINAARTQPYHRLDVWDGVSGSKIRFDPLQHQTPGLLDSLAELVPGSRFAAARNTHDTSAESPTPVATMCENGNLTAALLQQLQEAGGLDILDKTKLESIQLGPEADPQLSPDPQASPDQSSPDLSQWPVLTLPNNRKLAARLLVGADGANSPVRQFADIPSHGWDYNQHGVVATLDLDHHYTPADLRTAYQRFLPTGPIALLPLPGNKASLVWSTTPSFAAKLKSLPPADFAAIVNAAFRLLPVDIDFILSHAEALSPASELAWREASSNSASLALPPAFPRIAALQPSSPASFPLRLRHADTYIGHRIALLGDAAHTIHPLAGQGLNLGLADAHSLARRIAYATTRGIDLGSPWCLDAYAADRWAANNAMLGVVDKLHKLYSVASGPVVWGRSVGLDFVDRLGSVKKALIRAAAGSG